MLKPADVNPISPLSLPLLSRKSFVLRASVVQTLPLPALLYLIPFPLPLKKLFPLTLLFHDFLHLCSFSLFSQLSAPTRQFMMFSVLFHAFAAMVSVHPSLSACSHLICLFSSCCTPSFPLFFHLIPLSARPPFRVSVGAASGQVACRHRLQRARCRRLCVSVCVCEADWHRALTDLLW